MRLPYVQFTVRQMMVAVAIVALGCGSPAIVHDVAARFNWWQIKPYLNLVLVPLTAIVLVRPSPRRPLIWLVGLTDLFFLTLWLKARRPYQGEILLGTWFDDPTVVVLSDLSGWWYYGEPFSFVANGIRFAYCDSNGGLLVDLTCLILLGTLLALLLIRPTTRPFRAFAAAALVWARLYDWLAYPRMRLREGWPVDPQISFGTLDPREAPCFILDAWFQGGKDIGQVAALIGLWRFLELVVLLLLLVHLARLVVSGGHGAGSRSG
jgi:hypothetical protein